MKLIKMQQDCNFENTIKTRIGAMYSSLMNPVFIQEVLVLIDGFLKMKITLLKKKQIYEKVSRLGRILK